MISETLDYQVCEFFLSALINHDPSSLDQEEEEQLNCFYKDCNKHQQKIKAMHYTVDCPNYDEAYFARCELSNKMAMCVDLKVHFWKHGE